MLLEVQSLDITALHPIIYSPLPFPRAFRPVYCLYPHTGDWHDSLCNPDAFQSYNSCIVSLCLSPAPNHSRPGFSIQHLLGGLPLHSVFPLSWVLISSLTISFSCPLSGLSYSSLERFPPTIHQLHSPYLYFFFAWSVPWGHCCPYHLLQLFTVAGVSRVPPGVWGPHSALSGTTARYFSFPAMNF